MMFKSLIADIKFNNNINITNFRRKIKKKVWIKKIENSKYWFQRNLIY